MKDSKRRSTMLIIITISLFIVAVIGATFAYFASGTNTDANIELGVTTAGKMYQFTASSDDNIEMNITSSDMSESNVSNGAIKSDNATINVSLSSPADGVATFCTYDIVWIWEDDADKYTAPSVPLPYIDEDGVLFFVQRFKRMLIVSGYNVYPSHIEDVIMKHEYVLNCGVIGIPHPYKVEVPKAFIVLKNGVKPSSKVKNEIKEYCKKNLANYMLPKEYEFRESLPKTMIGKVDYRVLEKENK